MAVFVVIISEESLSNGVVRTTHVLSCLMACIVENTRSRVNIVLGGWTGHCMVGRDMGGARSLDGHHLNVVFGRTCLCLSLSCPERAVTRVDSLGGMDTGNTIDYLVLI
jgi:hypothetical protein